MLKTLLTAQIENWDEFIDGTLTGKTHDFTLGGLNGPAKVLFKSELEYKTMNYVLYSNGTPILWHGSFYWIMPPSDQAFGPNTTDYLYALEIADELAE